MTIRPILKSASKEGDLLRRSTPRVVAFDDREALDELLQDLTDTLLAHPICIGLAANQIGVPVSVAIVSLSRDVSEDLQVFVNPTITERSGNDVKRESCMSVPGVVREVKRSKRVSVSFSTIDGVAEAATAEGFLARAWQHEIDHLSGVLYDHSEGSRGDYISTTSFDYTQPESTPYSPDELGRLRALAHE